MTASQPGRAVRIVVLLLLTNLAVTLVFGCLTLVFRHEVLTYQLARHPGADPHALERTLWTRPIPIVIAGLLYIWVARQLLAGVRRAFRRVQIVSVLGFLAVGWLLVSAAYPNWLRVVQVVQLGLLAALIVAVNRPAVRAAFAAGASTDSRPRNRLAALMLVALTPVVAELSLGTVPLRDAWVIPLYLPIYGAGALFIREIIRRTGGGFANLLIMGVVYGLVEEGLALQSLTSPHLYDAAGWAPRLLGLNTAYAELNLVYHALFSVTIPVALVELVFHRHGTGPYLRRGGLIISGVVALLGALLLRVTVPPSQDPGYQMPLVAFIVIAAAAATLTVVALRWRVRPGSHRLAGLLGRRQRLIVQRLEVFHRAKTPPTARVLALCTGAATFAFLALIFPFGGARQPSFTHGAWALVPMACAALIVTATSIALRRWSLHPQWTTGHLLAAIMGALVGHTAVGLVCFAGTLTDRLFLGALIALTVAIDIVASRALRIRLSVPGIPEGSPTDFMSGADFPNGRPLRQGSA